MAEQKLELVVDIDEGGFVKGIRKIDGAEEKLTNKSVKRAKKQEGAFKRLGNSIKSLGSIYTAVLGAVVVGAFGKAIKMASDFNESNAKFQTTFAAVGKEANKMRDQLVNSFNLSTKAATELLGNTGDMLSGFGFATDKALELSGATNKLAADLSSFANVPIEQASEALTKGLLGEREMMKTLGIAILETDVQQRLMAEGKDKLTGMALKQAKAEVTLALAMEQSKNAIGDVARTQDSFANQMRKAQAILSDLAVAFGEKLLPMIKPVIEDFNRFANSSEGLEKISIAIKSVMTGFIILKDVVGLAVGLIIDGISAVVNSATSMAQGMMKLAKGDFKGAFESMKNGVTGFAVAQKDAFADIINTAVKSAKSVANVWKQSNITQIQGSKEVLDAATVTAAKRVEEEKKAAEEEERIAKKRTERLEALEEHKQDIIGKSAEVAIASINAIAEASQRRTDREIANLEKERNAQLEALKVQIDERNIFSEQLNELEQLDLEQKLERMEAEREAAIASGDMELAAEIERDLKKEQLGQQEKQRAEEIARAKEEAETKRLAEEERINAEFDKKIAKEKKKAFKKKKAADILSAGINTALGITSALTLPPPVSFVMAALTAALGAVQIGIIASKPVPEFNQGGFTGLASGGMSPRQDSITARLAPEENVFNKSQSNNLHSALDAAGLLSPGGTRRMMGSSNVNNNNQRSVIINGNVQVNRTDDLFDERVNRRQAVGGTFQ